MLLSEKWLGDIQKETALFLIPLSNQCSLSGLDNSYYSHLTLMIALIG